MWLRQRVRPTVEFIRQGHTLLITHFHLLQKVLKELIAQLGCWDRVLLFTIYTISHFHSAILPVILILASVEAMIRRMKKKSDVRTLKVTAPPNNFLLKAQLSTIRSSSDTMTFLTMISLFFLYFVVLHLSPVRVHGLCTSLYFWFFKDIRRIIRNEWINKSYGWLEPQTSQQLRLLPCFKIVLALLLKLLGLTGRHMRYRRERCSLRRFTVITWIRLHLYITSLTIIYSVIIWCFLFIYAF